jgi:biopolymer transport protein ExbD
MSKKNKHLDFEINLIPFIDLLSTCICFLLLTAVWINVGALNVKQAVGGQPASETAKKPALWVTMGEGGDLILNTRDARVPASLAKLKIPGQSGRPDLANLAATVEKLKASEPELKTALIHPQAASVYEDLIDLMDQFKKSGLNDLGVSPL